jgi:hypothetical protein
MITVSLLKSFNIISRLLPTSLLLASARTAEFEFTPNVEV